MSRGIALCDAFLFSFGAKMKNSLFLFLKLFFFRTSPGGVTLVGGFGRTKKKVRT